MSIKRLWKLTQDQFPLKKHFADKMDPDNVRGDISSPASLIGKLQISQTSYSPPTQDSGISTESTTSSQVTDTDSTSRIGRRLKKANQGFRVSSKSKSIKIIGKLRTNLQQRRHGKFFNVCSAKTNRLSVTIYWQQVHHKKYKIKFIKNISGRRSRIKAVHLEIDGEKICVKKDDFQSPIIINKDFGNKPDINFALRIKFNRGLSVTSADTLK